MPTAGEAGLKPKSANKTSKDGVSIKGKTIKKVPDVKRKLEPHPCKGKSSIPVFVKKRSVKGKENSDPNVGPSENVNSKLGSRVRKAPDFSKLHKKWEDKLSKGKAVSKKKNTTVEAFDLTESSQQARNFKRPYAYNSEDEEDAAVSDGDDDFEIDSTALKGILNNTGIKDEDLRITGRATIATIPSSNSTMPGQSAGIRTSIYYTRPKPCFTPTASRPALSPLKPRNIDTVPVSSQVGSYTRKQVAWEDQAPESESFDFQPDVNSLQSILCNTGITNNHLQNTGRATLAGGRLTPYRRGRQAFREEPSKRTSIYYTGPQRTRPSPRGPAVGRTAVLSARQTSERNQKSSIYNPLATMIGRQGQVEHDETDPIASVATKQFPTKSLATDCQPLGNKPLSTTTPARILVSSAQPSSFKDQPTWADILTPQRGTVVQETRLQENLPQASLDPLRTPRTQQAFDAELCTPQRVTSSIQNCGVSQEPVATTFVNSFAASERQPLMDSKHQLRTACNLTPQTSISNTRQVSNTPSVDFQFRHAPLGTRAWQPQTSSQAPEIEPHWNYSHTPTIRYQSSAKNLSTSAVPCVSTPMTSYQHRSELATPQADRSRLQLSTVQITSFQPSPETEISASITEARLPKWTPGIPIEQLKSTASKEEDNIAQLERQALEDLGLFHISDHEGLDKESTATSCTSCDKAGDVLRSEVSRTLARPRPLLTSNTNKPVATAREQNLSSCNVSSACLEKDSSFSSPARFANPTLVRGSTSATYAQTILYSEGSMREERQLVSAKAVYANSLSLRSALSSSNPPGLLQRNNTLGAGGGSRLRWDEPNAADDFTSVFRPAPSFSRRPPNATAQEALLDLEVSSYMMASHSRVLTSLECKERPMNPLAQVFLEGDSMHFHPVNS